MSRPKNAAPIRKAKFYRLRRYDEPCRAALKFSFASNAKSRHADAVRPQLERL